MSQRTKTTALGDEIRALLTVSSEAVACRNPGKAILVNGMRCAVVYLDSRAPDSYRGDLRDGDQALVQYEKAKLPELASIVDRWFKGSGIEDTLFAVPGLASRGFVRPVPGGLEWEMGLAEYRRWRWSEAGTALEDDVGLASSLDRARKTQRLSRLFPLVGGYPEKTLGFSASSDAGACQMEPRIRFVADKGYELRSAGGSIVQEAGPLEAAIRVLEKTFDSVGPAVLGPLPAQHPSLRLLPEMELVEFAGVKVPSLKK